MNKQRKYTWNERYSTATCTLFYKNYEFIGVANCHPDDKDIVLQRAFDVGVSKIIITGIFEYNSLFII